MSEIYKVKIGDIWLTRDGTETERECLLEIINIKGLRELYTNTAIAAVDGTQIIQTFEVTDVPFALQIFKVSKTVGGLLVDLYNETSGSGETVSFTANGGGNIDFAFDCRILSFDYTDTEFGWENVRLNLIKK